MTYNGWYAKNQTKSYLVGQSRKEKNTKTLFSQISLML